MKMETFADSRHKPPRWKSTATPTTAVLFIVCCALLLTMPSPSESASVYHRNSRHGNGNGAATGASAQSGGGNGQRGNGRNGRLNNGNGGNGGSASPPVYTIDRPAECRNETVFADCFLCGKIADDIRIYRACCQRDAEIISFCVRLLS